MKYLFKYQIDKLTNPVRTGDVVKHDVETMFTGLTQAPAKVRNVVHRLQTKYEASPKIYEGTIRGKDYVEYFSVQGDSPVKYHGTCILIPSDKHAIEMRKGLGKLLNETHLSIH